MDEYKLYVWDSDVLTDWESGMAVAVARSVYEARKTILRSAAGWGELRQLGRAIAVEPDKVLDLPAAAWCSGGQ